MSFSTDRQLIHEFPHVLGLRDLYDYASMRTLKEEYKPSIMANDGGMEILPMELERIIRLP